jgi:hypothetical protein
VSWWATMLIMLATLVLVAVIGVEFGVEAHWLR